MQITSETVSGLLCSSTSQFDILQGSPLVAQTCSSREISFKMVTIVLPLVTVPKTLYSGKWRRPYSGHCQELCFRDTYCEGGHGLSIGSLGKGGQVADVQNVL